MEEIKQIYRIEIPGIESVIDKVQKLTSEIELQKAIKKEAQKILIANPSDVVQIERQSRVIAESEVQLKKLTAEKKIASRESDVLIKAAQKQATAEQDSANASKFAAGSYNQLYASFKQLNDLYRNTPATDPLFDRIKADAVEAKKKVDDFNRSLSPDGTLVGEYKTGILNAFKDLGLTDVIKNQKKDLEAQMNALIARNKELASQFKTAGKEGVDAFNKVEKELKENIVTQQKLEANLRQINTTLGVQGGIGAQVTSALSSGFKGILSSGLSLIGIGFGLSEAFQFMSSSIDEFLQADEAAARLHATLDNLGRGDAFDRIAAKADEMAQRFRYIDNDEIIEVFQKLILYGKLTEQQMNDLLPVIIDFAAQQRISVTEASDIIVKALEGNAKGLKTYGINIKDAKNETERLNLVMTTLKGKVDGAGDAFQKSAAGGIAQSKQRIADLKEEIGTGLMPALEGIMSFFATAVKGIKPFFDTIGGFIGKLTSAVGGITSFSNREAAEQSAEDQKKLEEAILYGREEGSKAAFKQYENFTKTQLEAQEKIVLDLHTTAQNRLTEALKSKNQSTIRTAAQALASLQAELQAIAQLKNKDAKAFGIDGGATAEDEAKKRAAAEKAAAQAKQAAQEELQRRLRIIETLAIQERIALETKRRDGVVSEEQYQEQLFSIDKRANLSKQALYASDTAEQKQQNAQLKLELINSEISFNEKMFSLKKAAVDRQRSLNEQQLKDTLNKVLNDPNSTNLQKEQAQVAFEQSMLALTRRYNGEISDLETVYHKKSIDAVIERNNNIMELEAQSKDDSAKARKAELADITETGEKSIAEFQNIINRQREVILNSNKSGRRKAAALEELDNQESFGILAREVASMKIQLPVYQKQLENKEITEKEYADKYEAYVKKVEELNARLLGTGKKQTDDIKNAQQLLQKGISKLFNFSEGSFSDKLVGQAIAESFSLAQDAMDNYFDAEQARVEQSRKLQLDRLDLERHQAEAQAQSTAERISLEGQYDEKRKQVEKEAGARLKKIKKDEAKITLATEMGALAVAAAQNPLNGVTFGAAGATQFALFSALALARYLMNIRSIESATFRYGGNPDMTTTKGGRVKGRSHESGGNPFVFKGRVFEDEVDELNIIRTKNVSKNARYTLSGTHTQIASKLNELGGGIAFEPGAKLVYKTFAYGGMLGENLQAPVNPQSFLGNQQQAGADTSGQLNTLMGMVAATNDSITKVSGRIDRLEVVQVTRSVRDAIDKQVKNESIATL